MRYQGLALRCFFVFGHTVGRPLWHPRAARPAARDLLHLFGDGGPQPAAIDAITTPPIPVVAGIAPQTAIPSLNPNNHVHPTPTSETTDAVRASSITSPVTGGALSTASTSSIIADQVEGTRSPSPRPDTPSTQTPSPTPLAPYTYVGDASNTPPAELTEWKVIGIAVITITFIAIVIISVTFFDSWWGFLREVLFCGPRKFGGGAGVEGQETMVPDWEKRTWEFRLASEDGHRYPTLASLESIVKEKERGEAKLRLSDYEMYEANGAGVAAPESAYRG